MKQLKIIQAYNVTEQLTKDDTLTITAKWVLYKLRKELTSHYEFYVEESRKLFSNYETTVDGDNITFKTAELAKEYQTKQEEIDNFEVELNSEKQTIKLSDIPNITVQQIELLDEFIEFIPE